MSGQRPPTNTRASGEYNYSEGQHPSDDLLLACVCHQHLDNQIKIEQHIQQCPFCRQKCRAFEQDGRLIASYMQEQKQQFYPPITNLVMQRIALEDSLSAQERAAARWRQAYKYSLLEGIARKVRGQKEELTVSPLSPLTNEPLPPPFAELQADLRSGGTSRSGAARSRHTRPFKRPAAIALVVMAAVLTLMIVVFASPVLRPPTGSHVHPTPLPIQRQHSTPTVQSGQKSSSTPTRTSGPTNSGPHIFFCSTQGQINHGIIQICGSGFTAKGRVWLTAYGPQNVILPRFADGRGYVQIAFTLNDCRSIPLLITVVDAGSHRIATLQNISLSSCSSSRHH